MARKSRKKLFGIEPEVNIKKQEEDAFKIYNSAVYARLSVAADTNEESIENQIAIIKDFINKNADLKLAEIYADYGKTGTNFERPEFERMMEDVRNKKIDCIIVKDLSRFGRNFAETGNYF